MSIIVINKTTRLSTSKDLTSEQIKAIKTMINEDLPILNIMSFLEADIVSNQTSLAIMEPIDPVKILETLAELFG